MRHFKIYSLSTFQTDNRVLLTVVTMLCIIFPWLLNFITKCAPFGPVHVFCPPPNTPVLKQGSTAPSPGTTPCLQHVRSQTTQQEVSTGWLGKASSAAPHGSHYPPHHPPAHPWKVFFQETSPRYQKGWDHWSMATTNLFSSGLVFHSAIPSRSIHVFANGNISSFLNGWIVFYCVNGFPLVSLEKG